MNRLIERCAMLDIHKAQITACVRVRPHSAAVHLRRALVGVLWSRRALSTTPADYRS